MQGITIQIKILFTGEIDVGKTSFITRETKDTFHQGFYQNTIGVDFVSKDYAIGKDTARVLLWDIAGGDCKIFSLRTQCRGARAVCLCFSLNSLYSFQTLPTWIKNINQLNLNCPIYLVGCQSDLQQTVPEEEIIKFAEAYSMEYFKCSAKEDKGVKQNFRKIVQKVAVDILHNPELRETLKIFPKKAQSSFSYCHT